MSHQPENPPESPVEEQWAADRPFHGEVKDYRQPLVTSLGIILGFMLNFLAGWSNASPSGVVIEGPADALLAATIAVSGGILIVVLWRMLNPHGGGRKPQQYYATTVKLYLGAITISLVGFLLAIVI